MLYDKLTVVQVLPEMDEGGVEIETLDQAVYLAEKGHRSIVISGGGRLVEKLERAGCHHLTWPGIGKKNLSCLKYIRQFRQFLLNEDVDIVHLRSRLPAWVCYYGWKSLPPSERPPLITTFHGFHSVNRYSEIMTRGERVVAVSKTIKDHIVDNYQTAIEKITIIYGGFDREQFAPDAVSSERLDNLRKTWGLQENDEPVIILPGRLTKLKGQDDFIDSLELIKHRNFKAFCIGEINETKAFVKEIRAKIHQYGLDERVKLVGHCDDMPAAMLLGDIIVSATSTRPEAFGKVAVEAMAMGRPVIATAHGGSLETIVDGETGWLVEPQNPNAMAQAIDTALRDGARRNRLGEAGRRRVLKYFTAERMCEGNLTLYRQMLAERDSRFKDKKLTVLQMLPELESGGVERGTLETGKHLVANGHRSLVVSGGGRLVDQLEQEGSQHFQMSVGKKSLSGLKYIPALRKLMREEGVDILHLRSRLPAWLGYLAWKSLPAAERPVLVTTFHGFYSVNAYSAIMTKGEIVIAVSESVKEHIREFYGDHIHVKPIFRGVAEEVFNPEVIPASRVEALRKDWGLDESKPVVMLPGRFSRWKGQDVFLRSLSRLSALDFQAVLVGDPNETPNYTEELNTIIAKHKLHDRVKMVGHCSDMAAAYLLSDIVVSASSSEPEAFGRVSIEAMAMGKPVIATAHGGSLETVVDGVTGWLIEPADFQALARALEKALTLEKPELEQFGGNGRKRVLQKFTTRSMCEQTVDVYYRCLQNRLEAKGIAAGRLGLSS
ncbi:MULTISPECIES: glycosyltransferase family 4 protein [Desulfosediminicola]|uniref:glycosyltransferase family 4 protein n=1 Tax=Desulfosediminicola TaxID=2886823 RepID=UPI001E4EA7B1|nr:glycosyltransferase family 4 protein [Desulfosediminicola ganghwensis]